MCKRDEDFDLWSGNVQIQPWKFEPLKSDKDLVWDLTRWRTISTRLPVNNERIDQMDWWAFLNMFKTTLQRLLMQECLPCFILQIEMMRTILYCQYEKPVRWSPSCWCCFTWQVGVVFVLRILKVMEFSKVRKSSAQRKIVKVLSQWKLKYNITGRNLFRTLWFQRWFSL